MATQVEMWVRAKDSIGLIRADGLTDTPITAAGQVRGGNSTAWWTSVDDDTYNECHKVIHPTGRVCVFVWI